MGRLPEEIEDVYSEEDLIRFSAFFKIRGENEKEAIEQAQREADLKRR